MTTTVKPGYKQTEVGVIPEDWSHLHEIHFRLKSMRYAKA